MYEQKNAVYDTAITNYVDPSILEDKMIWGDDFKCYRFFFWGARASEKETPKRPKLLGQKREQPKTRVVTKICRKGHEHTLHKNFVRANSLKTD